MATSTIQNDLAIVTGVVTPNSDNFEVNVNRLAKSGHVVEMTVRGIAKKNLVYGDTIFTLPFKPRVSDFEVDSQGNSFYLQSDGAVTTAKTYSSGDTVCFFIRSMYITTD